MRNLSSAMPNGKQKSIRSTLRQCLYWVGMFVAIFIALFMTSCNDEDLAKAVKGTWTTGEHWDEDEDGEPINLCTTYIFKYNPKASYDGGAFAELCEIYVSEELGDFIVDLSLSAIITGKWEVLFGDISLEYDISSLEVDLDDLDVRLSDDADYFSVMLYQEMLSEGFLSNNDIKEIADDFRKEFYDQIRIGMQSDDCKDVLKDVKVEGETMSYEDEEEGLVTLTRVHNEE